MEFKVFGGAALVLLVLAGVSWTGRCDGLKPLGWLPDHTSLTGRRRALWRAVLALGAAFVILGALTQLTHVAAVDREAVRLFYRSGDLQATQFMNWISGAGGRDLALRWVPAILLLLLLTRRAHCLRFFSFTMLGALALESLFKPLFHRLRPDIAGRDNFDSFPSGHTLAATVLALTVLVIFLPACRRNWHRWGLAAGLASWPLLMAVSRVYLGAHFPTDVAGGLLLGTTWVCACMLIVSRGGTTPRPSEAAA